MIVAVCYSCEHYVVFIQIADYGIAWPLFFTAAPLQEKFSTLLFRACPAVQAISPHLQQRAVAAGHASPGNDPTLIQGTRKIRIAFLSKFFTMEHAHGELLKVRCDSETCVSL